MQRFFALLVLLVLSIPVGLSITGCQTDVGAYCNGLGYGPKKNQVAAIDLEPKTTGISLAWGQTSQLGVPSATSCGSGGTPVTVSKYNYGSSNLLLADVSPSGAVCGGTWNRNSPGGIADYTICTPPAGASGGTCTATSCGVAQMSVAAAGISSNPIPIYVHPPITSIAINPASPVESKCYSQNTAGPVLSPVPPVGGAATVTVLGPDGIPIPSAYVGTITYIAATPTIVSINNTSVNGTGINGATTANMPGSTIISATVSQSSSGSAAGYFYTCPPATIALTANGSSTGTTTVTSGTPVNISALIKDTNNNTLNGLELDYISTEPQEIAASPLGQVTATWPGDASVNAICQPATCNPAPISQIGIFGTGTPVVSNTLKFTSPGRNSNYLWMASTQSQFFSAIDLTSGTPGSPIRLPYIPNSMVLDQNGNNLYFGSYRELMIYSAATNALSKEDTTVPGVVLAVSPDSNTVVINDQLRQVIYLYSPTAGIFSSVGGIATRAAFSPDGKNIYIVGPNALYVHNIATGWSTYSSATVPPGPIQPPSTCNLDNNTPGSGVYDPFCAQGIAITVPSIGPFVSGLPTTAYGFCPVISASAEPVYYPQAASLGIQTDQLAATDDGNHILGADAKDNELSDIWVYQDASRQTPGVPTGPCPPANTGIALQTSFNQLPIGVTASEIDQVVASPTSGISFVTYNSAAGTGILPAYTPSTTTGAPGTISSVQLSGAAQNPVAGIFSPNETIFFVSTSGDNLVHFVDPAGLKDTQTINPGLVDASGNPVPVQMMAVKPRSTT